MRPAETKQRVRAARKIAGWFAPEAAALIGWFDAMQRDLGIVGDVFEIGVHHGKSAVYLAALVDPAKERFAVCDLFGSQSENASRSGRGQREIFERNLERFVPGTKPIVHETSSSNLTSDRIGSNHRIFHVDGGHHAAEALADLRLAAAASQPHGILVLDDPFKAEWPGVTEGLIRFLETDRRYRAVCVGFNKLICARREHVEGYIDRLDRREERVSYGIGYPWQMKTLPFLDEPLRIFYCPTYRSPSSLRTALIRSLESSELANRRPFASLTNSIRSMLKQDR